jgi:uncharacterized protein (DUF427 family)
VSPIFGSHPAPEPAEGIAPNGLPRESVWDYPRPPRLEAVNRRVRVIVGGETVVDTNRACRILETAGAPTIYVPPDAVADGALELTEGASVCEWKGLARYFDAVVGGTRIERAAWAYPDPTPPYRVIADWPSFYPALVECLLDDELVQPQPGNFYGGWVTAEICGPIKGEPGSGSW